MQIEVKHPTVQEIFADSFYEIPAFQREYVWKQPEVDALLGDAFEALFDENGSPTSGEYFIGSIVAYPDNAGVFQLIDGQQRITTLFILLCAIRDIRKALNDPEHWNLIEGWIRGEEQKDDGTTGLRLRLKPLYEDAGDTLQKIALGHIHELRTEKKLTNSSRNMLAAYDAIQEFLSEIFKGNVAAIRKFQAGVTKRIRLVKIQTHSASDALRIFETINDRGIGLNSLDLLKNLLFMQVEKEEFDQLTKIWKDMVSLIEDTGRGEKPLRFLRYFVLANFADARKKNKPLTEDDLYQWLSEQKNQIGISQNPLQFAKKLYQSAQAYQVLVSKPDYNLSNIYALSGRARQHLIVLLACGNLTKDQLAIVTFQLERLFVAYVLAQEPTKVLDIIFANAAPALLVWIKEAKFSSDQLKIELNKYVKMWVDKEVLRLKPRISDALDRLNLGRKTTCRFVLWRLSQYLEVQACSPLADTKIGHFKKFEVEHILPSNPTKEHRGSFDKPHEYDSFKQMLGNLTLLEKPINASIGRDYFADKKSAYQKSGLFMTSSLASSQAVGNNSSFAKAANLLTQFEHWDSNTISTRQAQLKLLVMQMWQFDGVQQ